MLFFNPTHVKNPGKPKLRAIVYRQESQREKIQTEFLGPTPSLRNGGAKPGKREVPTFRRSGQTFGDNEHVYLEQRMFVVS